MRKENYKDNLIKDYAKSEQITDKNYKDKSKIINDKDYKELLSFCGVSFDENKTYIKDENNINNNIINKDKSVTTTFKDGEPLETSRMPRKIYAVYRLVGGLAIALILCLITSVITYHIAFDDYKNDVLETIEPTRLSQEKIDYIESFGCEYFPDKTIEFNNFDDISFSIQVGKCKTYIYFFINLELQASIKKNVYILIDNVEYKEGISFLLKKDILQADFMSLDLKLFYDGLEYLYTIYI